MKKGLFSESLIIGITALLVMLVNIAPFLVRLVNTPPDKGFAGTQFYSADYSIYLGHFKEGAEGTWLVHDKHTSESQEGFILRREYIIWGFLTGYLLHLPIVYVYHSARIFSGFLLLYIVYLLIREFFPKKEEKWQRILAFLLATMVAGFPKYNLDPTTSKYTIDLFMNWFTEVDPTQRFATLFHYLLGNSLLLGSILIYIKYLKKLNQQLSKTFLTFNFYFLILFGWLAILIHPSTYVTLGLMFFLYISIKILSSIIIYIISHQNIFKSIFYESIYLIIWVATTLPLVLLLNQEVTRFPWNEIAKWDISAIAPINLKEYLLAIGPVFFLGCLGILGYLGNLGIFVFNKLFKRKSTLYSIPYTSYLLLFSFPSATFLLTFKLYPFIPDINRLRFLQVPIFVPFAIFGSITIINTVKLIIEILIKIKFVNRLIGYSVNRLIIIISFILFSLFFIITFPAYRHGILREVNMFPKGDGILYPEKSTMTALDWLDNNTKPNTVVLASWQASTLIPGFSGNFIFSGHPWSTVNFQKKEEQKGLFYQTKPLPEDARKFLRDNYIDYIYFGYQEKGYGGDITKYESFLKKAYQTPEVTIYKVRTF